MENKFPKNVRQIGNVSDTPKIYVEDYVDTFLNQICDKADKEQAGAFLVGKKEVTEGQECLYIFGAICMEFSGDENEIIKALKDEFEKDGIKVFAISAVSGQGLKELLYHVSQLLETCGREPVIYEQEYDPALRFFRDDPYTITMEDDETFVVEGPKIEKMLGYTNIESEKGFLFFQRFLKEQGILDDLEEHGIQEGDTVKMYGHAFEYYK